MNELKKTKWSGKKERLLTNRNNLPLQLHLKLVLPMILTDDKWLFDRKLGVAVLCIVIVYYKYNVIHFN